jgi:hypothetical protein
LSGTYRVEDTSSDRAIVPLSRSSPAQKGPNQRQLSLRHETWLA